MSLSTQESSLVRVDKAYRWCQSRTSSRTRSDPQHTTTEPEPTEVKREPTAIGRRVRQLRERRGLTQLKLAHRTGLALNTISRLEAGAQDDQKLSTLQALAEALSVTVADLLTEPQPNGEPAGRAAS